MRINEILVESTLEEGPILNKIGSGIGKAAGTVAKGVGAVAGGIAGIPGAVKKGFQAGKSTVAGGGDTDAGGQAAPAASGGAAPAAGTQAAPAAKQPGLLQKIGQAAGDFKKGFQQGSGQPAEPAAQAPAANTQAPTANTQAPTANTQAPAQAPAAGAQQPAAAPTGTAYAQVKAGVDKLDKKGKQRILQALQKEVGTPAAAAPTTTSKPAGLQAGGSAQGQSTAPADPNANAAPPEPGDQRWYNDRVGQWGWKGASGGWSGDEQDIAPAVKPRTKKPVNISGSKKTVQPQQQVASKEPKGNMVAESFSIFRKR
jgi:hypothetical protein